jgi:hypothetical protein
VPPPSGTTSTSRRAGWRRSSFELPKIRKPDLNQRSDRILEPGLPGDRESLLVALPYLGRIDSLLETIVTRDQ